MSAPQQALIASGGGHVPAWRTIVDLTPAGSSSGWTGYTLRHVYSTALIAGAATKARMTFRAHPTVSTVVDKIYMQAQAASGDAYDYSTTPIQVTVSGGSTSFTLTAGSELLSDEITITIGASEGLVIAPHFTASGIATFSGSPSGNAYYKNADDVTTVNASGYTLSGGGLLVRKLEVFG